MYYIVVNTIIWCVMSDKLKSMIKENPELIMIFFIILISFITSIFCFRDYVYRQRDMSLHIWNLTLHWRTISIIIHNIVYIMLAVSFFFVPHRIKFMYIGFIVGYFLFCSNHNCFMVINYKNEVLWTLGSVWLK